MTRYQRIRLHFFVLWTDTKALPRRIRWRLWSKCVLLWWYRLYVRKDEFHRSLDTDPAAMFEMNRQERDAYFDDLWKRRKIAHRRDLAKC